MTQAQSKIRMLAVLDYVEAHPGCISADIAKALKLNKRTVNGWLLEMTRMNYLTAVRPDSVGGATMSLLYRRGPNRNELIRTPSRTYVKKPYEREVGIIRRFIPAHMVPGARRDPLVEALFGPARSGT